jgi:hypothetical protein
MQYWAGAPPVAMTTPPVFALNPGQVAMTTIINYNSSEGQRVFREGTKSLFTDSNKFALTADRIQPFLQTLKARGSINGWDFGVNVGTAAAPVRKNLIDKKIYI